MRNILIFVGRRFRLKVVGFLCVVLLVAGVPAGGEPQVASPARAFLSIPIEERITPPPAEIESLLIHGRILPHALQESDRVKIANALRMLPPLAQRALTAHLRSISVLDGLPVNGITLSDGVGLSTVYDIVIRGEILQENISQFLTRKERTCYSNHDGPLTVSIEAGILDAVVDVLLHESIHLVDMSTRATVTEPPMLSPRAAPTFFTAGIWNDAQNISTEYRSPLFETSYFRTYMPVEMTLAASTYKALSHTPFTSLYATKNWDDDVAELATMFHLTQKLHQPYRIVIQDKGRTEYSYSPLDSKLVATRFSGLTVLYD